MTIKYFTYLLSLVVTFFVITNSSSEAITPNYTTQSNVVNQPASAPVLIENTIEPTTTAVIETPIQASENTEINSGENNASNNDHYINCDGQNIHSPAYYDDAPANATAICNDGTYSFSRHRRGTCSRHGGVSQWLY
jgi:hypothetical protein